MSWDESSRVEMSRRGLGQPWLARKVLFHLHRSGKKSNKIWLMSNLSVVRWCTFFPVIYPRFHFLANAAPLFSFFSDSHSHSSDPYSWPGVVRSEEKSSHQAVLHRHLFKAGESRPIPLFVKVGRSGGTSRGEPVPPKTTDDSTTTEGRKE